MSIGIGEMPFKHDPADCLEDILDNITRIESYTTGFTREMFDDDDRTRDASERCLERICEAVFRLGPRATELLPGQPLGQIRGMGNRLRHAYDGIDFSMIWGTIQDDLPALKSAARTALTKLKTSED